MDLGLHCRIRIALSKLMRAALSAATSSLLSMLTSLCRYDINKI